jgi:hypothetical protein
MDDDGEQADFPVEIAFGFPGGSSREIDPATSVIGRITRPVSSLDILGRAVVTGPSVAAEASTIPTRSAFPRHTPRLFR